MKKLVISLDMETNNHNKPRLDIDGNVEIGVLKTALLEIGFIVYEQEIQDGKVTLTEVLRHQSYIYNPAPAVWLEAPPVVLELHTKSGFKPLYDQFVKDCEYNSVAKNTYSEQAVDEYAAAILEDLLRTKYPKLFDRALYETGNLHSLTVVGKNVQFDIGFMNARLPRTAMFFNYQVIDVSMMRNMLRSLGNDKLKGISETKSTHFAIDDCESATADYKATLEVFLEKFPDTVEYFQQYKQNQEPL